MISTTYKTLQGKDASELRMVVGGDVSLTKEAIRINNHVVNFNPDIIMIGGDIAYDNGLRSCWYSWDNFYRMFD